MYRALTSKEVGEVLRRFGAGQSKREIARMTSTGRNTVHRYVQAALERGFSAGAGNPSSELVAAVVHAVQSREPNVHSEQRASLDAHRAEIEAWLEQKRRLTQLHELLLSHGVHVSYATRRRYTRGELGRSTTCVEPSTDGDPSLLPRT